jgi:hypothetical protein
MHWWAARGLVDAQRATQLRMRQLSLALVLQQPEVMCIAGRAPTWALSAQVPASEHYVGMIAFYMHDCAV